MKVYHEQKDLDQASFDNLARIISEHASEIQADGNIADLSQETLEHLEYLSIKYNLNPHIITAYLEIITENNDELKELEEVGKFRPLGFTQGNVNPRFVTRG